MKKFIIFDLQRFAEVVSGTEGADNLTINSDNAVAYGYGGSDTIYNRDYNSVTISGGDGADSIVSRYSNNVSIVGGAGNDYVSLKGNNSIIDTGADDDIIKVEGTGNWVDSGTGNDDITNYGSSASISTGDGNDNIWTRENNTWISSGSGNDSIYNYTGNNVSMIGGNGDDTFESYGTNLSIVGGAGDDKVSLSRYASAAIKYTSGDGDDVVYNFNEDDALQISGSYTKSTVGNDVIVSIGSGSVTLKNAINQTLNIVTVTGGGNNGGGTGTDTNTGDGSSTSTTDGGSTTTEGMDIHNTNNNTVISGSSYADTITNTGSNVTIQGGAGNDSIYSKVSYYAMINGEGNITIDGGYGDDTIYNNDHCVSINGGSGDDSINCAGADLTIKGGKGNDTINYYSSSNIYLYSNGDGDDIITGYVSSDTIQITDDSSYSTTASGDDVVIRVGSGSITLKNVNADDLNIIGYTPDDDDNYNDDDDDYYGDDDENGDDEESEDKFTFNDDETAVSLDSDYEGTFDLSDYASTLKTVVGSEAENSLELIGNAKANYIIGGQNDDILEGGKGNDTLKGGAGIDIFVYSNGDGNDVITDYKVGQDSIQLYSGYISSSSLNGSDVVLKIGSGSIKVKGAKGKKITVTDSNGNTTSKVYGTSTTLFTITNSTKSPVAVGSAIKTIDASKRTTAIKITGNSLANMIKGGSSADTIFGGVGNDSIIGNNGNDKLFGDTGNDTLRGGIGNDSIQGGAGNDKLFGDNGNDTLRGGAGNDSVTGGAGADKLFGDAGADTLNGGKGNDTLSGGAGADVFIYANGDGNDVITDYTAQDKLRVSGSYSTLASGNDVIVKVGSGKMTLKNAKGVKLNITRSSGYEERWFTEDDNNYITSEVSSILKSDNLISNDYKIESDLQFNQNDDITSLTYSQSKK